MKNSEIKVSVIMSTYNTPKKFLEKSIESILNQSHKNLEFIIVCDGPSEDFITVSSYKDTRIKIIQHEKNMGLAKSMNEAIKICNGKYIFRMDSDDISLKNRIKVQIAYMEKHPEIMVSGMQALCFGDVNTIKYTFFRKPKEIVTQLLFKNPLIHPSVVMRSEYLIKNKINYDENFLCSQDFELWARILDTTNSTEMPKVGILYRVHKKQISSQKQALQKELREKVIDCNILKLSNQANREILMILSGSNTITKENYKKVSNDIDNIIKLNTNKYFDTKILKKVLYNRFLEITMTTKEVKKDLFTTLLKEKSIRRKIINLTNILYICDKAIKKIKAKFIYIKVKRLIS